MKRYILLLGVLLCCVMLKAQSVTYTCRYWFDQNHEQAVTASFNDSTWQAEIDVGLLSEGFHKFHLQIADTAMKWSSPQTYLFFKIADNIQENLNCHYWFDQNHAQIQHLPLGNGQFLLDVSELEEGLHTVNVLLEGDALTTTKRYVFMKEPVGNLSSGYRYHCWFDQDFEHRQTDSIGDGHLLLDVSDLEEGIHTVNVLLEGDALTTTKRYVFMKVPVVNPSAEFQYHLWFDNDINTMQTGWLGSGCFQLEVDQLAIGFHTVSVQLDDNGTLSAPKRYMFYKRPFGGCITKWEYWLNGDYSSKQTTELSPYVDTLDIIALLPVETWPVRSTCFHFQPNGEEPYLNAKNEITFRFWDVDKHFIDKSTFYIDENVSEPIVADTLERNTTVSIVAPRDNQIHWFKLEANRGDYLSFQADKACTMQLFAPSGEEVYAVLGPESIQEIGFNVWEDGVYYLAVHDVTGSGETVSVTYNWVYRYVIASYDVHLVGNGGRSTITFQGNGFNSLLDVYLVNVQNDTIRPLEIGHESNTTTTVTFNFYEVNLGMYDAVFEFYDETILINGALEVQEPVDIVLTTTVSYPSRFLINTPCTYTYTITNNGNMTAYNVPLEVQIYTPDSESLTRVDIGGFNVKSYIREILGSYYSDSLDNVIEQKMLVSGDLFGFLEDFDTDFIPEAPCLHHIIISPTLRPNTTETFTIAVQSANSGAVYMWYPDEWENIEPTKNLSKTESVKNGHCQVALINRNNCKNKRLLNENGILSTEYDHLECCDKCPPEGCQPPQGGPFIPGNPSDPNDIHGYLSESGSHYMRQEIQNVQYEIEFENDTTLATAAAHTIIVRDTLDATKFDLNSLAARSVTIGDKRLDLNGEQTFARTLDMRPELYVIAQIEQDYDPTTGIVEWTIQSLDPMTMEPTDNPYQGVLPVNYFGNGVGFIDYSINLKQAFADGTAISNRAGIIFDQEEVIMTPTWTNIVDAVKPTSHIEEVTFEDDTLNFSFISSDNRSGVWYHSLYYRNDSTYQEWQVKVPRIFENSYMLRFNEYQTTEYLVMAVDSAGNVEDKEMVAEYVYYYVGPAPTCQSIDLALGWNWFSTYLDITLDDLKTALVEAMPGSDISIKSQTQNISYNPNNHRWLGTMAWDVAKMYAIKTSIPCEITLIGTPLNPSEHPITILNGANWIGFPFNASMSLSNAFAGFSVNGDRIKSQTNNALYNGVRWQGQLNALESGKGYIYISSSSEERTLTFPTSAK